MSKLNYYQREQADACISDNADFVLPNERTGSHNRLGTRLKTQNSQSALLAEQNEEILSGALPKCGRNLIA